MPLSLAFRTLCDGINTVPELRMTNLVRLSGNQNEIFCLQKSPITDSSIASCSLLSRLFAWSTRGERPSPDNSGAN